MVVDDLDETCGLQQIGDDGALVVTVLHGDDPAGSQQASRRCHDAADHVQAVAIGKEGDRRLVIADLRVEFGFGDEVRRIGDNRVNGPVEVTSGIDQVRLVHQHR